MNDGPFYARKRVEEIEQSSLTFKVCEASLDTHAFVFAGSRNCKPWMDASAYFRSTACVLEKFVNSIVLRTNQLPFAFSSVQPRFHRRSPCASSTRDSYPFRSAVSRREKIEFQRIRERKEELFYIKTAYRLVFVMCG